MVHTSDEDQVLLAQAFAGGRASTVAIRLEVGPPSAINVAAETGGDHPGVLEEKTKGNLSDEEDKELRGVLQELRARYVELAQMVAKGQIKPASPHSQGDAPAGGPGPSGPVTG